MKKIIFKNFIALAVIVFLFGTFFTLAETAKAAPDLGFNYVNNTGLSTGNVQDPRQVATNIVKYFMTFLGIIAVVIILLGGFKWMTAAGNEDKVAEAKKLLVAGIIGLIIILAAYLIVNFVVATASGIINNGDISY